MIQHRFKVNGKQHGRDHRREVLFSSFLKNIEKRKEDLQTANVKGNAIFRAIHRL